MIFDEIDTLLRGKGLISAPLPSGAGCAYFLDDVMRTPASTRIIRVHHNQSGVVTEIKRSVTALQNKKHGTTYRESIAPTLTREEIQAEVDDEIRLYRSLHTG
jgi:hypothetical protein